MLLDVPGERAQRAEDRGCCSRHRSAAENRSAWKSPAQAPARRSSPAARPVLNSGASGSISAGATPSRLRALTMNSASSCSAGDWVADMNVDGGAANRNAQSVSSASARRMPRAPYKKRRNPYACEPTTSSTICRERPAPARNRCLPPPDASGSSIASPQRCQDDVLCVIHSGGCAARCAVEHQCPDCSALGGPAAESLACQRPGARRPGRYRALCARRRADDRRHRGRRARHGGICSTAKTLYATVRKFQEQSDFPHLLRMWNYLDAINEGEATRSAIGSSASAARSVSTGPTASDCPPPPRSAGNKRRIRCRFSGSRRASAAPPSRIRAR